MNQATKEMEGKVMRMKKVYALDPFCVEKNLRSWASSRIIARGRDYYRRRCVLSLESYDDNRITAQVEGTIEEPYRVEIQFDAFGMPVSNCTCPFKWEPLCKHAVAVLIAWQQEETGSEPALGSFPSEESPPPINLEKRDKYLRELAHVEREARRIRCTEQGLRIIQKPQETLLGEYAISSGNPARKGETYQVIVRDSQWRHVSCDCADFRTNELGACKHIELVKKSLNSQEKTERLAREEQRSRQVSIYVRPRETHDEIVHSLEEIRFHIPPQIDQKLGSWIRKALDPQSYLLNGRGPLPQKVQLEQLIKRLSASIGNRERVQVDPQVYELLRQEEQAFQWKRRIQDGAKTLSRWPAWQKSVGSMRIQLHHYQTKGILFAVENRRAFIGDDMGLGKTVQAIGAALLLKEMGEVKRTIVITPASLKFQWKQEIQSVSTATVTMIGGSARDRSVQYQRAREFFILLNYELLYRDLASIISLQPDLIILDEAQRIKNWETKIAQTIKQLKSPFRLVLTGTPLENRLAELHSVAEFLNPRALGAAWKLMPTYAQLDENDKLVGYSNLDHLRQRMKTFLIRRTRREVLTQLPKRTDNNFWTKLTPSQKDVNDELAMYVKRILQKWERFKSLTKEDMQRLFMLLTCMRMACNAYGQYNWKPIEREVLTSRRLSPALKKKIGSPKLEEFHDVMADLLENPEQKVVVFSQWERMIRLADLYIRDLMEATVSCSVIFHGSLSLRKREAEIKRFLDDQKTRVFFSTDSGGVGLNLQRGANCVINLEIPWNPAVLEQRIGRIYRMGQKKSVQVINFISSECVEERLFNLVAKKKALFSGVFDEQTKDIRFNATQMASFADKMKQIVPEGICEGKNERQDSAETDGEPAVLQEAADSVAKIAPTSHGQERNGHSTPAPAFQVSLTKLMAQVKVSQNQEGVQFSIPQPAVDALKALRPLLETLLKLGSE